MLLLISKHYVNVVPAFELKRGSIDQLVLINFQIFVPLIFASEAKNALFGRDVRINSVGIPVIHSCF